MSLQGTEHGSPPQRERPAYDLVLIGASTGGPRAVLEVLSGLPADFGAGVVIAQHMPAGFTRTFAARLDRSCALPVREAQDGDPILANHVLVAPGGRQTGIERRGSRLVARVTDAGALPYHPSIDHLYVSAATAAGARVVAVILTGMGSDGSHGLQALHDAGALTIVESRDTAVVYGMPGAASATADRTLRIEQISVALTQLCRPANPSSRLSPAV